MSIEAFLLANKTKIKDGVMKTDDIIEEYSKVGTDNINPNIITKKKYALKKYGAWTEGYDNISDVQKHMIKEGYNKIMSVGQREYCRQISKVFNLKPDNVRTQLLELKKYGRI